MPLVTAASGFQLANIVSTPSTEEKSADSASSHTPAAKFFPLPGGKMLSLSSHFARYANLIQTNWTS
jgi:hypothetical protein